MTERLNRPGAIQFIEATTTVTQGGTTGACGSSAWLYRIQPGTHAAD